jgi:acetamidase/formamidase
MATHHLDGTHSHPFWDNSVPPRLSIQPGDTVVIEVPDASNYQITDSSTVETLKTASLDSMDQLTGPVVVQGAQPGDALEVEVLNLAHKGWGWSAVIPGFGLLADDFSEPLLHMSRLEGKQCWFTPEIRVPFDPFLGTMGVAPAEPGRLGTIPPGRHGGNLDIRHLTAGTRVRFPVWVPGALFSCGDCHAAQGDGEVNGTGIESPMTVTLRFDVIKGANLPELRFITPRGRRLSTADLGGYYVTTAHGPDLYKNAQHAIRYMLEYLVAEHGLSRQLAYCLCGVAVDLKISQIVDAPNWMVSAYLPLSIFVGPRPTIRAGG